MANLAVGCRRQEGNEQSKRALDNFLKPGVCTKIQLDNHTTAQTTILTNGAVSEFLSLANSTNRQEVSHLTSHLEVGIVYFYKGTNRFGALSCIEGGVLRFYDYHFVLNKEASNRLYNLMGNPSPVPK